MCSLTRNVEQALLHIDIDDLGHRLHAKSGVLTGVNLRSAYKIACEVVIGIYSWLEKTLFLTIEDTLKEIQLADNASFAYQILKEKVSKIHQCYSVGNRMEQVAGSLTTQFLCTSIGSIKASEDIQHSHMISPEAFGWFSLALNSDAASSRLKLASALYCAADLESCDVIQAGLGEQVSQTTVVTKCSCIGNHNKDTWIYDDSYAELCYEKNEDAIKHNTTFCVTYLPCEINCIPEELKYEMFRFTEEDWPYRGEHDNWMDWAVVDSLPYLHFLQYKVYSHLQRPDDKLRALNHLIRTINTDQILGHRETAFNLLGQCMEQENRIKDALLCYKRSMNVRGRNNAAKWHVCRMLARQFRRRSK